MPKTIPIRYYEKWSTILLESKKISPTTLLNDTWIFDDSLKGYYSRTGMEVSSTHGIIQTIPVDFFKMELVLN
jgi:hypothetical protein